MQINKKYKIETVLIIDFDQIPEKIQELLREQDNFNRGFIKYLSNLSPCGDNDDWGNRCSLENIEKYRNDQINCGNFSGTLEKFIEEYYLELDYYMIKEEFNLKGVKTILIEV